MVILEREKKGCVLFTGEAGRFCDYICKLNQPIDTIGAVNMYVYKRRDGEGITRDFFFTTYDLFTYDDFQNKIRPRDIIIYTVATIKIKTIIVPFIILLII